jgi:hypothetical protein
MTEPFELVSQMQHAALEINDHPPFQLGAAP